MFDVAVDGAGRRISRAIDSAPGPVVSTLAASNLPIAHRMGYDASYLKSLDTLNPVQRMTLIYSTLARVMFDSVAGMSLDHGAP